jgi:hypothetical protein
MNKSVMAAAAGITLVIAATGLVSSPQAQQSAAPPATPQVNVNDWLLNAPTDTERFKKLQIYLRGFDQPMWEVGERYQRVYDALGDGNYDLAEYHWEKIKSTITTGYMKRPKRQPNSDAMFVKNVYDPILAAIKSKDAKKAWEGFELGRAACMSCHEAEQVGFMNNQPLFRRTENPPKKL